jgi:hypothetical protein
MHTVKLIAISFALTAAVIALAASTLTGRTAGQGKAGRIMYLSAAV